MAHTDLPLEQLRSYAPEVHEPSDFDAFWERTLREARACGGEVILGGSHPHLPHIEIREVKYPGFGGEPIKAWYARPAGVSRDLPCIVQIAGYGGGRGLAIEHTLWPSAGYAHLFIDTRGQGSNWGNGGDTADAGVAGPHTPGFMTRGVLDPDQYYFRRVIADAVRGVDAARGLPRVDPQRIVFAGMSQGGGVALAVAGLVPDLAAVLPDVPFLCHFRRAVALCDSQPYAEITKYLSVHRDVEEQVFTTLSYMDGVNHSKRATAPSLWSVALMDQICPPSTVFTAFNHYGAAAGIVRKDIEVYAFNDHEGGDMHQRVRQLAFLADVLGT